jgi:uncharacterized protein (DUF58 family)
VVPDLPPPPTPPAQRRYHFHWPGVTYVVVTLFLAVGALNSQNNLLFATLGVAMGGLLISGIISGWSLMGLRLERDVTTAGTVGEPMPVRYVVHNTNRLMPAFALHLEEVRPRRAKQGWWDFFDTPRVFVAFVPPRGRVRVATSVTPTRRGEPPLDLVRVWSTFPFGLAKKSMWFRMPDRALIYPAHLKLRTGFLRSLAARSRAGLGDEPTPGMGDEFYGLREYVPGDRPRRIAWKPSARTGTLVIRQHSAPSPVRLWVVVKFGSSGKPVRNERAIALAGSILREAEGESVAVGLCVPRAGILHAPRLERRHVSRMLESLARLEVGDDGIRDEREPPATRKGTSFVVNAEELGSGARFLAGRIADTTENARLLTMLGGAE